MLKNEKTALLVKKEANESHIKDLTENLDNTTREKRHLESQNHQFMVAKAACDQMAAHNQKLIEAQLTENRGLRAQVEMKEAELASLHKQITSLHHQGKSKQDELNTLQQQITSVHSQSKAKQEEIASLHTQNEAVHAESKAGRNN